MLEEKKKEVILVDSMGCRTGRMEKILAHKRGELHSAYSIFIYNQYDELLLQKRAVDKYHSSGLWSNSCCSHPEPDDKRSIREMAEERLLYEMGIKSDLTLKQTFCYKQNVDHGLIEYEYDYIFIGKSDNTPILNNLEVSDFKWKKISDIIHDVRLYPANYTMWFKTILENQVDISINYP